MHLSLRTLAVAAFFSLSQFACEGTNTGNPNTDPTGGPGLGEVGGCKKQSSTEVAPDALTFLGATPDDVLAMALGSHTETLTWHAQDIASYGPESGEHELVINVASRGAARVVKYVPDDNGVAEFGGDCGEQLELPVRVDLSSDGGALDEHFDATLVARSALSASLHYAPSPTALGGSFAITTVHRPGFTLAQVDLSVAFTRFGSSGSFDGVFEIRSNDSVGAAPGNGPLASWGLARCPTEGHAVPLDQDIAGFSGNDVLAMLQGASQGKVSFDGATPSNVSLSFVAESGGICALLERPTFGSGTPGTLLIGGTLTVDSADGRIDARWPVRVRAVPNEQAELGELTIGLDTERPARLDAASAPYGLSGVDVAGFDSSSLGLALQVSPSEGLRGTVSVTGFTHPMCSTDVVSEPGGGSSSPGCPGSRPTEVTQATFTP